jgi:hypothetical protein
LSLHLRAARPLPVYVAGLDSGKGESRKVRRRRIIRPIGAGELHPDSVLAPATLEAIERGELQFRWDQIADTGRPTRQERARLSRRDRDLRRRREHAADSCVCPWVALVTPIPQAELDRLHELKRAARRSRNK